MLWLNGSPLTLEQVAAVSKREHEVALSDGARERVAAARQTIERILERGDVVYGVNTGFGKLSDVHISADELGQLQVNLIRSHACGVGNVLSPEETRAMMLLRANVLATGHSGARALVIDHLLAMLNADILPRIPEKGSVGASGDLAPLAHLALAMIGEGQALHGGSWKPAALALEDAGLEPLSLEPKEGLVLINGTQAIGAVGSLAMARAQRVLQASTLAGAMSLEALLGTPVAFDARISDARGHEGQSRLATILTLLLADSSIRESHRHDDPRVQDAYCLRCMPQVHGAVWTALQHAAGVLETESGAATDNPLVFPAQGDVLSGGNFHAAPLAYVLDYAAIALTDLMGIAERRIDRLVNPDLSEGLPPFLTGDAGSSSGFMIPHVVAVALLNECKVLAHPASVDNVPTSGGKEDHVSMGMTSALKFRTIVENAERIVAIELMAAAEGLEFRKPLTPGAGVQRGYEVLRSHVQRVQTDRSLSDEIERVASLVRQGEFAVAL